MVGNSAGANSTACLATVGANSTAHTVHFNVSGSTAECEGGLRLIWDGDKSQGPYNVSVIPLDGGYTPWIVPLSINASYYDWQVNMTQGSYFTLMFK